MAGKLIANKLQIGDSATATNNFVLQTNVDGSAKLSRGNDGATTQDILTVGSDGKITLNQGIGSSILVSGTAQTASGTSVDFTGIPSWVKRITVMFDSVSTNGASQVIAQIGDSGGIENTGYTTYYAYISTSTVAGNNANTNGFSLTNMFGAPEARSGHLVLTNINGNIWIASAVAAGSSVGLMGGTKTLSSKLDRLRITAANGTDTFDAGTINIMYE